MTTGIIAAVSGAATIIHTPSSNGKVRITGRASSYSYVTINGVAGIGQRDGSGSAIFNFDYEVYVGAGQPLTLVTTNDAAMIVSTIEEVS